MDFDKYIHPLHHHRYKNIEMNIIPKFPSCTFVVNPTTSGKYGFTLCHYELVLHFIVKDVNESYIKFNLVFLKDFIYLPCHFIYF